MKTTTPIVAVKSAPVAILNIAGLRLLLPQHDLRTVESASDVDDSEPEPYSVGWIKYQQKRWPTYCLSDDLALLSHMPPTCRACVLMAVGDGYIGIMSDDVIIMRKTPERQYELPAAMKMPETPIKFLLSLDDAIVCVTEAQLLFQHINRMRTS